MSSDSTFLLLICFQLNQPVTLGSDSPHPPKPISSWSSIPIPGNATITEILFPPFIPIPHCLHLLQAVSKSSLLFLQDISRNLPLLFISISHCLHPDHCTTTLHLDYCTPSLIFSRLSSLHPQNLFSPTAFTALSPLNLAYFSNLISCPLPYLLLPSCTDLYSCLWTSYALSGAEYFLCPFAWNGLCLPLKWLAFSHL